MKTYDTLIDAITDLRKRGYERDYNLLEEVNKTKPWGETRLLNNFVVNEVHRFEGDSNPDDNMVLFALHSRQQPTEKGLLVAAYGPYVETSAVAFIQQLDMTQVTPEFPGADLLGKSSQWPRTPESILSPTKKWWSLLVL